jgi:hypothetical protein
LSTSDLLGID